MFEKKGNNKKDHIGTEQNIYKVRSIYPDQTMRNKVVHQDEDSVFDLCSKTSETLISSLRDRHASTSLYRIEIFPIFGVTDGLKKFWLKRFLVS